MPEQYNPCRRSLYYLNPCIREILCCEIPEFPGQEPSPDGQLPVMASETSSGPNPEENRTAQVSQTGALEVVHHEGNPRSGKDLQQEDFDFVPIQMVQEVVRKNKIKGTQFAEIQRIPLEDTYLGIVTDRPISDGEDARITVQRRNAQLQSPVPRFAGGPYRVIATSGPDIQERVPPCRDLFHHGEKMFAHQRPAGAEKKVYPMELPDGPMQLVQIRIRPFHSFLIGRVSEPHVRKENIRFHNFNSFS
jgi:hypothetical protein